MNDYNYELWIREKYEPLVRSKTLTTVVRPEDRTKPNHPKYVAPGMVTKIRIITRHGDEKEEIMPEFNGYERDVKITKAYKKRLKEITSKDLDGSSEDARDLKSLLEHLKSTYERNFELEEIVTVEKFEYL